MRLLRYNALGTAPECFSPWPEDLWTEERVICLSRAAHPRETGRGQWTRTFLAWRRWGWELCSSHCPAAILNPAEPKSEGVAGFLEEPVLLPGYDSEPSFFFPLNVACLQLSGFLSSLPVLTSLGTQRPHFIYYRLCSFQSQLALLSLSHSVKTLWVFYESYWGSHH